MGLNLDLSGAKESGFGKLPNGWYNASIFEVTIRETKGGEGKVLPAGTPMLNIQFRISEGEYENRRAFRSYVIAPDKVPDPENPKRSIKYENKSVMDGMLFSFLKAAGYDSDNLKSGNFSLDDPSEMQGRDVRIKIGARKDDPEQDDVKDVKAATSETQASDDLGLLG